MTTLLETSKIFSWHFNPFEWHSKWHLAKKVEYHCFTWLYETGEKVSTVLNESEFTHMKSPNTKLHLYVMYSVL